MRLLRLLILFTLGCVASNAFPSGIRVEVGKLRANEFAMASDQAMRLFTRNMADLSSNHRASLIRAGLYDPRLPLSLPQTVVLTRDNQPLPPVSRDPRIKVGGGISLAFDSSGLRSFPSNYKTLLEDVFAAATPAMNVVFGQPASSGTVFVRNYDSDISDRSAVSGGYYLPNNGSAQHEIRFPVYTSPEATAVNFVHCLLLAYQGNTPFGFDAFQEGLVRAAVQKVLRTPGSLASGLDPQLIEAALNNTYDVGTFYDWNNQPALGGSHFVAPNLANNPLPSGGSVGGLYLLRYQMAGTAWHKLIVENPGFIAEFNRRFYLNPGWASDVPALIANGQAALDTVKGTINSTVEGRLFASWYQRQFVLETADILGQKLLIQAVPLQPISGSSDFGVFDVIGHYFETKIGGDELLLSGVSYPIFWDNTFNRVFPSAQEDRMDLAGAYGSVAPNLPDLNGGVPYRVAVDLPLADRLARVYLPAGAIETGSTSTPRNFYGTVVGAVTPIGATLRIRLGYNSTVVDDIPLLNGAFGSLIADVAFDQAQRLTVEVIKNQGGSDSVLLTRLVNKAPGAVGLDLRVNGDVLFAPPGGLQKGIQFLGMSGQPFGSPSAVLGVPEPQLLMARFNANKARYDLYPDCGGMMPGNAYFLRLDSANPGFFTPVRYSPNTETSVALRPGWNMITCPLLETVPTSRVRVVRTIEVPKTFAEALGTEIGLDFFEFQRGTNDAVTGAPETGTMVAATRFESGKGYFVRCLAPEGAALVFAPAVAAIRTSVSPPKTLGDGWEVRAAVTLNGRVAKTFFGQASHATTDFESRFDSAIPPRMVGGLQLWSSNVGRQYRDIREVSKRMTFRIYVDGLTSGQSVEVKFATMRGSAPRLRVVDPITNVEKSFFAPDTFRFVATQSSRYLDVTVEGLGR